MNPWSLLEKYYPPGDPAREILFAHSWAVGNRAIAIAQRVAQTESVDLDFINEAAFLHDIGVRFVYAPKIGCFGPLPYLAHGYKGRELLEAEGWPRHALICERHTGVGLTAAEIVAQHLPLPVRDMVPTTIEEIIITYADLFFSKGEADPTHEKSAEAVRSGLARFGAEKVATFDLWHARFAG